MSQGKRLAPHLRVLDSREEKLDILLDQYDDAQSTLYESNGGGDGGCLGMPSVWNKSYRELERSLKRMRDLAGSPGVASPSLRTSYVHLCEWYLRSLRKRAPLIRKDKKDREYHVTTANGPQYVIVVVRKGNAQHVLHGLEWISHEFVGEIYLPKEFGEEKKKRAA